MQGTSLEEVFSNFGSLGAPVDFLNDGAPVLFGIRPGPSIPTRDASGSMLYQLAQERLFQSLTEEPPRLDLSAAQLKSTIDHYNTLRNHQKYLTQELEVIEKNIQGLEDIQRKFMVMTTDYNNTIFQNGILSREEFTALQDKLTELRELQKAATEKCLGEYKKTALEISMKLEKNQIQLSAYSEFIKTGVKEMVGPEVKQNSCTICFQNEITHCFVPCGHTFCNTCITSSQTNKCMTCRADIQKTIKIFLGV